MPIQYKDSIMESTIWCREHASLFDVSHMCGLTLKVRPRCLLAQHVETSLAPLWSIAWRLQTGSRAQHAGADVHLSLLASA